MVFFVGRFGGSTPAIDINRLVLYFIPRREESNSQRTSNQKGDTAWNRSLSKEMVSRQFDRLI